MNTVTYSEARNNLKHICDQVRASHDATRIVRKNGDVILVSAEDWESIEETLHLINLPGAVERITDADDYQRTNLKSIRAATVRRFEDRELPERC